MKNRRLKILPYEILSEYDCSLYLDFESSSCWATSRGCTRFGCAGNLSSPGAIRSAAPCSMNCTCCSRPQEADPSRIIDQFVFFSEQGVPDITC